MMLHRFLRRAKPVLEGRVVSAIRTDTRRLIRMAGLLKAGDRAEVDVEPGEATSPGQVAASPAQALTEAETRLGKSILLGVASGLSLDTIEKQIIKPVLDDASVLSFFAQDAVKRVIRDSTAG